MTQQTSINLGSKEDAEPYYQQVLNHLAHTGGLDLTIGLGVGEMPFDTAVKTGGRDAVYDNGKYAYQGKRKGGLQICPYYTEKCGYETRDRTEPAPEYAD